jgi:hypothetical protein
MEKNFLFFIFKKKIMDTRKFLSMMAFRSINSNFYLQFQNQATYVSIT